MILKLKGVASILLILSMTLPLSRCNQTDSSGKQFDPPRYTYQYALSDFKINDIGNWLLVIAFIWPLGSFLYQRTKNISRKWFFVLEIILCVGSGYFIYYAATLFGQIWIGGWIALFSITTYFILSIISFWASLTRRSS
ncbi:MAG: hypothetical protein ABSD46_01735 [Bacteroidota bacterium]